MTGGHAFSRRAALGSAITKTPGALAPNTEGRLMLRRSAAALITGMLMLAASPLMAQSDLGPVTIGAGLQSSYVHNAPDKTPSNDRFFINSVRLYVNGPV